MQAHFLDYFWLHLRVTFGAIWGAKCATILIVGPLGLDVDTLYICEYLVVPENFLVAFRQVFPISLNLRRR